MIKSQRANHVPIFSAADQINEKVEKSIQNSSQQKEKSISFATPLSPVKSNEIGEMNFELVNYRFYRCLPMLP